MTTSNRNQTQAKDAQVIVGIEKDLQNVSNLLLAGETFTPPSLVALVQSRIDAANAVATAKASWQEAVKTYKALNTKVSPVVQGLKQYVFNAFGKTSPKLADFGFAAPRRATLTPEQTQAAVEKRKATRKARNTMGPKAKLKIKGTPPTTAAPPVASEPATSLVTAPTATPLVTVNVAPAPAAQPASAAPAPQANGAPTTTARA